MKQLKIFLLMMLLCVCSVNAGTVEFADQTSILSDFKTDNIGNEMYFTVLTNTNLDIESSLGFGLNETLNITEYYDIKLEFPSLENDIYLKISNNEINSTLNLIYSFDTGTNDTVYASELILSELGYYYFKIDNSIDGDTLVLFLDFEAIDPQQIFLYNTKDIGISKITNSIFENILELIEINLSLWKIAYYLILIVVVVVFLILIIMFFINLVLLPDDIPRISEVLKKLQKDKIEKDRVKKENDEDN